MKRALWVRWGGLLGLLAVCSGCEKKYNEAAGECAFPVPVHLSCDGTTLQVQVPAGTAGNATTTSGSSSYFNSFGNALVAVSSADQDVLVSITYNGNQRYKRISRSKLA